MFLHLHWDSDLSSASAEGFTDGSFRAGSEKGDVWALMFDFQQVVLSGLSLTHQVQAEIYSALQFYQSGFYNFHLAHAYNRVHNSKL